jgi:hypothetical protein
MRSGANRPSPSPSPQEERYFYEVLAETAIYLEDVEGLPLPVGAKQGRRPSLYCHQNVPETFETARYTRDDLMRRRYRCNLVPPLDAWFGVGRLTTQPLVPGRGGQQVFDPRVTIV